VSRRLCALALVSALIAAGPASGAVIRRVLVISPSAEDARIALLREAINFWRDTFVDLGLPVPLVIGGILVKPASARALENFAWQISRLAGHLPDGAGPSPPPELLALDADVVVLLSEQPLMAFARPLPEPGRYLVAIARGRDSEQGSGTDRNVLAHELGHVLGLSHGSDSKTLMCEPCRSAARGEDATFRPLTDADRARLIELFGSKVP
jgi:hypothetical protein